MRSLGKTIARSLSNRGGNVTFAQPMPGLFGGMVKTNRITQLESMGSVGTLFAIINAKSEAISEATWRLYRKPTQRTAERREVFKHQALKVWNNPNEFYTQQKLVEALSQHNDLTGEGRLWVRRESRINVPTSLWVMRPDRVEPVRHPEKFIDGYVYTGPDGIRVLLDNDEVLSIQMPDPMDPYRGMGPVQSVLMDLQSTKALTEWNRNFFSNSARPGGIIEVPEILGEEENRQLKQRWLEQHQGTGNAHRVSILQGGMKWVDASYSMRDMQFVELRKVASEVIREAFRFPVPMLGTTENVNRANADAAELVFARRLVRPALNRIKQMLNNDYLPMFFPPGTEPDVEFDYDDVVPDDEELELKELEIRVNAYKTLTDAGVDPVDAAMTVDLPPMNHMTQAPMPVPVGES